MEKFKQYLLKLINEDDGAVKIFLIAGLAYASSFMYTMGKYSALNIPHDLMENIWFVFGETIVFVSFLLFFSILALMWAYDSHDELPLILMSSYYVALSLILIKIISENLYYIRGRSPGFIGMWMFIILPVVYVLIMLFARARQTRQLTITLLLHVMVMVGFSFVTFSDPGVFSKNVVAKADNVKMDPGVYYVAVGVYRDNIICKDFRIETGNWGSSIMLINNKNVTFKEVNLRDTRQTAYAKKWGKKPYAAKN